MNQELLKRLQKTIKEMSVNSLGSIYPEQLLDWLNTPQAELKQFIDDLYGERLISYKYKFKCRCGNYCTAYLRKLRKEPYLCMDCEAVYDIEKIKEMGTLVYELEKSDILDFEAEKVDFKRESLKSARIVYLDTPQQEESKGEKRMEIFLGSSSEAKTDMEDIGYQLEQLGNKAVLWNSAGDNIFPPNDNTIDSLIAITKRVQAAVFIFNADDKVWHHNSLKESKSVRDNVLFEYGLFCGALGKSRVCFVCKNKPTLASDLSGLTYIDGNSGEITVKRKLKDWIDAM
ncbi:hypothetical protein DW097_24590 [Enterocloster clostridioformis]|uniref:nucleotide-binding protein n=1 Tax=Enterocloster bolteae TaxID=208479 RepID=UPI000E4201EE|nr:nucleotide-binding protein [Enterocloster bolteae]RGB82644.1 hypothetical protein DW097_24590 [Enterocloster clostridioformis]RGK78642.1 hypothetical protein DXC96_02900 [Enterocloster bolteae]